MLFPSFSRRRCGAGIPLFLILLARASPAAADDTAVPPVEKMPVVTVTSTPALPGRAELPEITQAIARVQMDETVNAVDAEDMVKYLPSLFLRKRNAGDNQAVLATRTWGLNSSARSLVYADGVLLSALIANNNTIGAPRWGLVTPEEIERIDVLYGPFAAAYPGNSMGAVMVITTRLPEAAEASLTQTEALQSFSLYGTKNSYLLNEAAATAGDRAGPWSFWISADGQDSHTQPLTFVTAASLPSGTSGGIVAANKLGQPADVLGAAGILHADLGTAKFKTAYDFGPAVRATYILGLWRNDTDSAVQTYLRDASGLPTFAGQSGFATGTYHWLEEHSMQSLALHSSAAGDWDWQAVGTLYRFDQDTQTSPATVAVSGTALSTAGKVALLGGTGWSTLDLQTTWHPEGRGPGPELSGGAHLDTDRLVNPTYNTPDWQSGQTLTSLATEGNGQTQTKALWLQAAWPLSPRFQATAGVRAEAWRASEGLNVSGGTTVVQPDESAANVSPKGTLAWSASSAWTLTASLGRAYRYPTAGELYQLVSTGTTFTSPNPDLAPEAVWSGEARAEYQKADRIVRATLFQEDVTDALISQYGPLVAGSATDYQYVMNVGRLRNRGIEFYFDQPQVLVSNLELSGSVTYVDSVILADGGQGQFTTAVGKRAPYVPDWRATFVATYRPTPAWAWTLAGRYSGHQYSTVDNSDTNPHSFGGFDEFFVLDTHARWGVNRHWTLEGGVDNLLNRRYFLFHPFPQRTVLVELKYRF